MNDTAGLEEIFDSAGFCDYRWIDAREVVVAEWVRFKCLWGCTEYGRRANCPPNQPPVVECERFVRGYERAVVFHFSRIIPSSQQNSEWTKPLNATLYDIERSVFLEGCYKAFALYPENCSYCAECSGSKSTCRNRTRSRPGPDALGIDVYATVRKIGYPIAVVRDWGQEVNRYGFLLVD